MKHAWLLMLLYIGMSIICVLRIQGLLHIDAYLIVGCVCHTATKNIPRGMFQGILQKYSPTSWQYLFNKKWFIYTNNTTVPYTGKTLFYFTSIQNLHTDD